MDKRDSEHIELLSKLSEILSKPAEERESLLAKAPDLAEKLRRLLETTGGAEDTARTLDRVVSPQPRETPGSTECDSPSKGFKSQETLGTSPPRSSADTAPLAGTPAESGDGLPGGQGRLGGYELLHEIARGGMGVVFKARQISLNRIVAIKVIRSGELAGADEIERFYSEAKAAGNLDHPHIVPVYEVAQADGRHYFSMGFVDGESLATRIEREGPMAPRDAAQLMRSIVEAVAFAHEQGVIHRDLKPANVLMDQNDRPRLTDFGLAKRLDGDSGMTASGMVMGTPSYMPPEQAAGRHEDIGPLSDVYSLGAILYELLTGRPPHRADSPVKTIMAVLNEGVAAPRSLRRDIPQDLETICLKCLSKEPRHRYASCQELAAELDRFLAHEPISARPLSRATRAWRWCRRKPVAAGLIVASILAVLASGIAAVVAVNARHSRQVANLERRLEQQLQQGDWSPSGIEATDQLIADYSRLAPGQAPGWQKRVRDGIARQFDAGLRRPTLQAGDVQQLEGLLSLLESRNEAPEILDSKRKALQQRLRLWQPEFALSAPFDDLARVFETSTITPVADHLEVMPPSPPEENPGEANASNKIQVLRTQIACDGPVHAEADFANWGSATAFGLFLNLSRDHNYRFVLSAGPPLAEGQASPTFGETRERGGSFVLMVIRDRIRLFQQQLFAEELPEGPVTLSFRREGPKLTAQLNDQAPMVVDDLFPLDSSKPGVFGVAFPPGVALLRMRGSKQATPPEASPLESGDALFAEGRHRQALEYYEQQAVEMLDGPLGQMLQYKIGLCHLALKRLDDARETFERLAAQPGDDWPVRAACQLWLVTLRQNRRDEADEMLDALSLKYRFEDLAVRIPPDDREQILSHYSRTSRTDGYLGIRPNHNRVRNLERVATVQTLVGATEREIFNTKLELARTYHYDRQAPRAAEICEDLLQLGWLNPSRRCSVLREYAWVLTSQDRAAEAVRVLSNWLTEDGENGPSPDYAILLVDRAQVHAQLANWDQAERDLNAFLNYEDKKGQATNAHLVLGFVLEAQGRHDEAVQSWKKGYELARQERAVEFLPSVIAGSLSQSITAEDAENTAAGVARVNSQDAAITFLRRQLVDTEQLRIILTNMWRSDRGREYARRIAFQELPYAEHFSIQVVLAAAEICRLGAEGTPEPSGGLTPDEEEMVWHVATTLFREYAEEQSVNALGIAQLGLTFNGSAGMFSWKSVASSLKPELRGPMAYLFGRHYRNMNRPLDAIDFWKTALADAPDNSVLKELAQERIAEAMQEIDPAAPPAGDGDTAGD